MVACRRRRLSPQSPSHGPLLGYDIPLRLPSFIMSKSTDLSACVHPGSRQKSLVVLVLYRLTCYYQSRDNNTTARALTADPRHSIAERSRILELNSTSSRSRSILSGYSIGGYSRRAWTRFSKPSGWTCASLLAHVSFLGTSKDFSCPLTNWINVRHRSPSVPS